jgi:hypothetical protein
MAVPVKWHVPHVSGGRKIHVIPPAWNDKYTPYNPTGEPFPIKVRDACSREMPDSDGMKVCSSPVRIAKVIVVGDMSVGKTSLVNRCLEISEMQ